VTQALIPLREDAVREAALAALFGRGDSEPRAYGVDLVGCLYDEVDVAVDLFRPELGYLTSSAELEAAAEEAVTAALLMIRSTIARRFAQELVKVPAPQFVAPSAGAWIAEHWPRRGETSTWHRASGDLRPRRDRLAWPTMRTLCGRQLRASWRDDGTPVVAILRAEAAPLERACRKCARAAHPDVPRGNQGAA
jgi:hypothetical protein